MKSLFFVLTLVITTACKDKAPIKEAISAKEVKKLLIESDFGWGGDVPSLEFFQDGRVHYTIGRYPSVTYPGTFSIQGKNVLVKPRDNLEVEIKEHKRHLAELKCQFGKIPKPDRFLYQLDCGHVNLQGVVATGEQREISQIPYIIVNKYFEATSNVIMRQDPTVKAPRVKCRLVDEDDYSEGLYTKTYLKKGEVVYVIGRTLEKEKIKGWYNYWYYISVPYDEDEAEDCTPGVVWVFAQFFRAIKSEN